MKLPDKFSLVIARLKAHKTRTVITILTMSVLFGVVIAAMMIIQGNFNNLEHLNQEAYGDHILLKASYYGSDTESAHNHIARAAAYFHGDVIGEITHYCSKKQIDIPKLSPYRETFAISTPCNQSFPGESVDVIQSEFFSSFVDLRDTDSDSINIVIPVIMAGKLQDISQPTRNSHSVTEYIKRITDQSVGYQFTATSLEPNERGDNSLVPFMIAGLTPSRNITTFSPGTFSIFSDIMPVESFPPMARFIVINPEASVFRDLYYRQPDDNTEYLISFSNIQDVEAWLSDDKRREVIPDTETFRDISINAQELFTTRISNSQRRQSYERMITEFAVIFTIISVIIMAGTLSRMIDDEKSSIALYRSIGATASEILQIFALYMLTIGLLVILSATIIGILISLVVTLGFGSAVTATARSLFLLPDLGPLIMVGFDWKIIFVWLSVLAISAISLLAVNRKLNSKDVIKDLKR